MSETERLVERLRAFGAVDENADWEDVLRRAGGRFSARRLPRRKFAFALAAALVAVASVVGVLFTRGQPGSTGGRGAYCLVPAQCPGSTEGVMGPGDLPTLARPLPVPGVEQVSLSDAVGAFGGRLVLPDISQVGPSDVGTVWLNQPHLGPTWPHSSTAVAAVTFPTAGVWVQYEKGVNVYTDDVLLQYQAFAHQDPDTEVIDLNGVPAVVHTSTYQGSNASVEFSAGGVTVAIIGHADQTTMRAIAQSIVDRSEAPPRGQLGNVGGIQLFSYFPPAREIELADATATLGASVILPDTSLVSPSDVGAVWAERTCPAPRGPVTDASIVNSCWIWVSFPSAGISVGYLRPPMYIGTGNEWKLQARMYGDNASAIELGRVPALAIEPRDPYPGSIEFDLDGTRVVVAGNYDTATLQAVAQSIVDRAHG